MTRSVGIHVYFKQQHGRLITQFTKSFNLRLTLVRIYVCMCSVFEMTYIYMIER